MYYSCTNNQMSFACCYFESCCVWGWPLSDVPRLFWIGNEFFDASLGGTHALELLLTCHLPSEVPYLYIYIRP